MSFWQNDETNAAAPTLYGSRDNVFEHNLIISARPPNNSTPKHALQFIRNATGTRVANNVVIALKRNSDGSVVLDPTAAVLELDSTSTGMSLTGNYYVGGTLVNHTKGPTEIHEKNVFDPAWFVRFSTVSSTTVTDFASSPTAPWLKKVPRLGSAPSDLLGAPRSATTDVGPFERK